MTVLSYGRLEGAVSTFVPVGVRNAHGADGIHSRPQTNTATPLVPLMDPTGPFTQHARHVTFARYLALLPLYDVLYSRFRDHTPLPLHQPRPDRPCTPAHVALSQVDMHALLSRVREAMDYPRIAKRDVYAEFCDHPHSCFVSVPPHRDPHHATVCARATARHVVRYGFGSRVR